LIGNQFAKCIYDGNYKWSDQLPTCRNTKIIEPTVQSTLLSQVPTVMPDPTDNPTTADIEENSQDGCTDNTSFSFECLTKIQIIIAIVVGGIIVIIVIALAVACFMKSRNDKKSKNKDAYLWDQNPTLQKETNERGGRNSSRGNPSTTDDRIVVSNMEVADSAVPSHSFWRAPSNRQTQYQRQFGDVSSPQRPFAGPYQQDPSNDNHYPASRGPSKNTNYQYHTPQTNRQEDQHFSTFMNR
jgi:hypothetical protein